MIYWDKTKNKVDYTERRFHILTNREDSSKESDVTKT